MPPLLTHASEGDLKHSQAGLVQSLVKVTAPFPGSRCTQVLVPPPHVFLLVGG